MVLASPPPEAWVLLSATVLDLAFGDPVYRWHPVRLMGRSIARAEACLRYCHLDGRAGGCLLVLLITGGWSLACLATRHALSVLHEPLGAAFELFAVYSLLALGDLLRHGDEVDAATNVLTECRAAVAKLVGRDTSRMDAAGCRRATIESLAENLVDGVIAPILWYSGAGLAGIVAFKAVSTMDSMVGLKTSRYRRFGWLAARTDDLLNLVPARLCWLVIALVALFLPAASGAKALRLGWQQHSLVPGPNPGWSEAAMAGALQRRLVGEVWLEGRQVTNTWLGFPPDPPAGGPLDYRLARRIVLASGLAVAAACCAWLASSTALA